MAKSNRSVVELSLPYICHAVRLISKRNFSDRFADPTQSYAVDPKNVNGLSSGLMLAEDYELLIIKHISEKSTLMDADHAPYAASFDHAHGDKIIAMDSYW